MDAQVYDDRRRLELTLRLGRFYRKVLFQRDSVRVTLSAGSFINYPECNKETVVHCEFFVITNGVNCNRRSEKGALVVNDYANLLNHEGQSDYHQEYGEASSER